METLSLKIWAADCVFDWTDLSDQMLWYYVDRIFT